MACLPPDIADEIVHATLEDGTRVCIRSIGPEDEPRMREGIGRMTAQSRYLRFFSVQPMPPDAVVRNLVDADGHRHIAWGAIAIDRPEKPAIGAVHAVRSEAGSGSAEFSVAVLDAFQGIGLARMLIAVLLTHCRIEGIGSLEVQTLSENGAAIGLVESLGGRRGGSDMGVVEFTMDTAVALARLESAVPTPGLRSVLAALARYGSPPIPDGAK